MKKVLLAMMILAGVIAYSCKGNKTGDEDKVDAPDVEAEDTAESGDPVKTIFYNLRSPIETAILIKRSGVEFNESYLNPVSKASTYETNKKMSLNIGVYSADLGFASLFDRNQVTMNYIKTNKEMAERLGISQAVSESDIKRLEANASNNDSMMTIISETFLNMNSILKEDGRGYTASLILAGGWIEGLYLATQLAKEAEDNEKIEKLIIDQRISIGTLLDMLEAEKTTEINADDLIAQLKDLQSIFGKVKVEKVKGGGKTKKKNGKVVLGAKTKVKYDQALLDEIYAKVEEIRETIVN
jgi:hypothetical protein